LNVLFLIGSNGSSNQNVATQASVVEVSPSLFSLQKLLQREPKEIYSEWSHGRKGKGSVFLHQSWRNQQERTNTVY
jgi:hypothetical protein